MILTKEKLLYLWRSRDAIFLDKSNCYLIERYNRTKDLFDKILSVNVSLDGDVVNVNGKEILLWGKQKPSLAYFSCAEDEITADSAYKGVDNMREAMPDYADLIDEIGCMLGGFDFANHYSMRNDFRIISNTVTRDNDNGSLVSSGQTRHPSSHFADNNYFFVVIKVIKEIAMDKFNTSDSKLVLRWPNESYYGKDRDKAEQPQRETLKYRFPYKFFYMWTHQNLMIHPISLLAYKNLATQEDDSFHYYFEERMDEDYDHFISEEGWQKYSAALRDFIPEEERGKDFMDEFSKLISVVMCQDQETKNMKELLETGNKAIILWGPPGTGKTYSAEGLVCQELDIDRDQQEEYHWNQKEVKPAGCWDIVQFHPNYTYEDFIGGITPCLNSGTLSYELKEGIFKKICDSASFKENQDKKFLLIIDEINRADLSAVFGELMYALEYRGRQIKIPNFSMPFVIPKNVYLIGTMNSVDKSLATFDLALRRRFGFYKVMPNEDVLPSILAKYNIAEENMNVFVERCKSLNVKIENSDRLQLGSDYQIGHAYYAKVKDFLRPCNDDSQVNVITSFEMEKLWQYHLCPLLEEYLGNRIDDSDVKNEVDELKKKFTDSY